MRRYHDERVQESFAAVGITAAQCGAKNRIKPGS